LGDLAGRVEDWLARFDAVTMERSWNGFTIARKAPPVQIEVNTAGYRPWRVPLQLRYEGREFGSVSLEVAIDDAASGHQDLIEPDGIALAAFEIDPPRLVPCLDVPNQIAQKVHACTEPLPGGILVRPDVASQQINEEAKKAEPAAGDDAATEGGASTGGGAGQWQKL
jgi:hypothetical protein